MNRTGWAAALAAVLGIALAGVIGYMVWHSAGHSYQAVETQTAAGEAGRDGSGGQAQTQRPAVRTRRLGIPVLTEAGMERLTGTAWR